MLLVVLGYGDIQVIDLFYKIIYPFSMQIELLF